MSPDIEQRREHFDVLVVGAGHAGAQVAIDLIESGYDGTIGLIHPETGLPYQRPPLTKGFLGGELDAGDLGLRPDEFWSQDNLELIGGVSVVAVDADSRSVLTDAGAKVGFEHLVWAAGAAARELPIAGRDLPGVFALRTLEDAVLLRNAARKAHDIVVVGGGFVGLEAAASFAALDARVTVLEAAHRLLARVTGDVISDFFESHHESVGVDIRTGCAAAEFVTGAAGAVAGVRLGDGQVLPADLVLVAIGVVPNVGPLAAAGARCDDGVVVDEYMQTSLPDVYAVGDCTRFPFGPGAIERIRLESLQNATGQAKVVARAIQGKLTPYELVPWFWSNQYHVKFKTVGTLEGCDRNIVRGDPASGSFSVVYLRGDVICSVDSINNMKDYVDARGLIGRRVDPTRVADPTVRLRECVLEEQREPATYA